MNEKLRKKGRRVILILAFPLFCAIIIGTLAYWTYARNEVWNDELHLWITAVKNSPLKARPYNNVGAILMSMNGLDMALPWIERAVVLDPKFPESQNNLAILLANKKRYDEALKHLKVALKYQEHAFQNYAIHNNLGIYYYEVGNYDLAIFELKESFRMNPSFDLARNNLEEIIKNRRGL